jgi:hypothetical protein
LLDARTRATVALAHYRANRFAGNLEIPIHAFPCEEALFVKLERGPWFFDEAGWIEISAIKSRQRMAAGSSLPHAATLTIGWQFTNAVDARSRSEMIDNCIFAS